jgi:hypothetical protein
LSRGEAIDTIAIKNAASNITAPTQLLDVEGATYAYRRFGGGPGVPCLCLRVPDQRLSVRVLLR